MQRTAGGRADDQLVGESTKMCLRLFTDLSNILQDNREGLPQESIDKIRDKIAVMSGDIVTGRYMLGKTTETIESVLAEYKSEDNQTPEDLKNNIKQRLEQIQKAYDVKKEADYVQVVSILKAPGGDEMDEDIDLVVVDKGLTDADTLCPFTMQPYKDPMKNPGGPNHASCIHHVSRETLEIMCKTKAIAACPIAGCRGKWSKATAVLDEAFQRRVTRFLLSKEAQQGGNGSGSSSSSSSSAKQATAHDVDGDYTQL